MECPVCKVALEDLEVEGLCVSSCAKCQGMWLDEESFRLAKDLAEPDAAWLDFDLWNDPDHFRARSGTRPCPSCAQPMVLLEYGQTDVAVDHCDHCRGVWLDGGELEGIVGALRTELASMTPSDYLKASIDEASELVTGPESTVSEWKDLKSLLRLISLRVTTEHPTLRGLILSLGRSSPLT